jgi:predicted MPP superfamily phosphohydrolase
LPPQLDGLTIAHLSDLHMTGTIGREFYDCVVDETNALDVDLIAITGDVLEKEACLPWIAPTLGRLRARGGKYFILGNHERRLRDVAELRHILVESGLTDLGGRCELQDVGGVRVLLAGTEVPWFGTEPAVTSTEYSVQSTGSQSRTSNPNLRTPTPEPRTLNRDSLPNPFRILLSHSPDQLPWARRNGFDLMLAGHNHGGQIRLPYFGALIAPSWYGCRYAGGLYCEPPTLLHVSRGLCAIHPIRLNCAPELALLTLTCG